MVAVDNSDIQHFPLYQTPGLPLVTVVPKLNIAEGGAAAVAYSANIPVSLPSRLRVFFSSQ